MRDTRKRTSCLLSVSRRRRSPRALWPNDLEQLIDTDRLHSPSECLGTRLITSRPMDQQSIDDVPADDSAQPHQRFGHLRTNRPGGFDLHERQRSAAARNDEIHLEALLIAEIVNLLSSATIDLLLDDFGRNEALEQRTEK